MIYILIFIGTVLAFWISALCGGGASLILIPALGFVLPSAQVPAALTIGTFTSSASRIAVFKKYINWKIVIWFLPAAIPAVWLGAWLLKYINPLYLEFFIGLFLIANVRQLVIPKKKLLGEQKPYPQYVLSVVGFLAGFVSGITGAVGLLFNRFYLRYGLSKEEIVATRAANEICLHVIKLVLYITMGIASRNAILIGLVIAAGAVLSSITIKLILPYLSEALFRRVGYTAMVLSGLLLLTQASGKIIQQDQPSIHFTPISDDFETQLAWRESEFTMEVSFDKGFEIEQTISLSDLPARIVNEIQKRDLHADKMKFEKVYRVDTTYYEVYLISNEKVDKVEIY